MANRTSSAVLIAVQHYTRQGWQPVPIPHGEKGPRLKGWQDLRLEDADLAKYFAGAMNVGLLLGEPSRGLVDVDLDCSQAIAMAEAWMPSTQLVHGRAGKPHSHRWYVCDPIPESKRFCDVDGAVLIELRSNRHQTLVPPSVHPSGEVLRWELQGAPARVSGDALQAAAARVAAISLLARHWPERGSRHEAALALAGLLLRAGWREEEAMRFVSTVAQIAGDEEYRARAADVRATAQRLTADRTATGRPRLAELVGKEVVDRTSEWLGLRRNLEEQEAIDAGPYEVDRGRICIVRMKEHGPVRVPLCNFVARVIEEIVLDDGAETTRAFVLEGELATGEPLPPIRVAASRFTGMAWVPEHWGLAAIVSAGLSTRDQLREAIQRLSPNPHRRQVFVHTGWRQIDEKWLYMTAGGAVGCDGFEVDLGHDLARYSLPRTPDDPGSAMRLSLRLLDIAPLTVTAPLWSAMFRAPLASACPLDISIWVEGVTGSLKSTLAALFLSHSGVFERTSLPGAWSSTANQLERRAFILKDSVFVVDDYAPSALDARELEAKAARLLRSQGNLSGRGRLRADLTERPAFPPRGLIVGTGEQHPPGQSLLARMFLVEMERSTVNLSVLSKAQNSAARLSHAMAGYLLWLAPQMPGLPTLLRQTFDGARSRATAAGEHLRVPEALAHLWMGLHCALSYAEEVGACTHKEAEEHRARCWDALLTVGGKQAQAVEAERPSGVSSASWWPCCRRGGWFFCRRKPAEMPDATTHSSAGRTKNRST